MNYTTNIFLEQLFQEVQPKKNLLNCEHSEADKIKNDGVQTLQSILKLNELKRLFEIDIAYEIEKSFESMEIQIDKYKLSALKNLDFPVYHLKPKNPKGKVILYLHGHDDLGIMGAILERYDKVRYHKMIPVKLAKAGYDVYAPELIGMGEASFDDFPTGSKRVAGCVPNAAYLTLAGFNIAGVRVYQAIRVLDFMERLGVVGDVSAFGISGGGMTTQHILPLDARLAQGIVACYANTYKDSVLSKEHCTCNYVPGLLQLGDSANLLALALPKKLLTVNGLWDRAFPEKGSQKAFEYLEKVYEKYGVKQNYAWKLIEGKHEIDENVIIEWLENNA